MNSIITRCHMGARDLYHGIPDLRGATVVNVIYEKDCGDYCTTLIFKDIKGEEHQIIIKQA